MVHRCLGAWESIGETLDALPEKSDIEVDKKAEAEAGQTKVRDDLSLVDGQNDIHCFQFNDNAIVYQNVDAQIRAQAVALIDNGDLGLRGKIKVPLRKLDEHAFVVDALQEPGTHRSMNIYGRSNHHFADTVLTGPPHPRSTLISRPKRSHFDAFSSLHCLAYFANSGSLLPDLD
jgi:hypothetical protein